MSTSPPSSPPSLITSLSSPTPSIRLQASHAIKNLLVGNPTNKRLFLTNNLLQILLSPPSSTEPSLLPNTLSSLGSLSPYIPSTALPTLLPLIQSSLFHPSPPISTSALRALKLLTSFHSPAIHTLLPTETPLPSRLIFLLNSPNPSLAQAAAQIIANLASATPALFPPANTVPPLVALLASHPHQNTLQAALAALSALAQRDNSVVTILTKRNDTTTPLVAPFIRPAYPPSLQLAAANLLTIFHYRRKLSPPALPIAVTTTLVTLVNHPTPQPIRNRAKHVLALLLHNSEHLQRLAADHKLLDSLANSINASRQIQPIPEAEQIAMLDGEPADTDPTAPTHVQKAEVRAASLTALAAITADYDEARERAIALQLLPHVVNGLSSSYPDEVLAALKALRSLSRSVKVVRRDMSDDQIGNVLLDHMASQSRDVARVASAALCNLVLEFSPVRDALLQKGATKLLVDFLTSGDEELRKNALWALKNLFFKADADTKNAVMAALGYDNLQMLCSDKHPRVRELAMTIMRNLACSGSAESQSKQLDALFAATGGDRLISILSDALRKDSDNSEVAVQALYVVCNIASGTEEHKASLINSDIPQLILWWSSHSNENARIAAVWCTMNLSWKGKPITPRRPSWLMRRFQVSGRSQRSRLEMLRRQRLPLPVSLAARRQLENSDSATRRSPANPQGQTRDAGSNENVEMEHSDANASSTAGEGDSGVEDAIMSAPQEESTRRNSGYEWRIGRLRELGFECRLRSLINDPHIEVQGRARAALELFDNSEGQQLDYDPAALLDNNSPVIAAPQAPRSPPVLSGVAIVESESPSPASSR